jgi:regulator of sigma E protease
LDANANTGPVNPGPTPSKTHDLAEAGPIDPATGQPDHGAEVSALKAWLRENRVSLVVTAIAVALVCVYLDPIDTLKVVLGLGFIIFIHELGHFLAAKWCDVHVSKFSIGFGPAVPFCSYKWGETTYMVGIIPLGGFVKMVGEGDDGETEEAEEEDPRSFRKKSVGQRMLIISAGVIMNILLGMACFVAAYLHGVQEKPATVGYVEGGGAAWRAGLRTGDHITKIDGRENPWFDDLRPIVMSSRKDEQLPIEWNRDQGAELFPDRRVSPIRDDGQRFPQLGISPPYQLTLISGAKRKLRPTYPGSPAAEASGASGEKFEPGDRIVEMSDPDKPGVTPVSSYAEYHRRMVLLADKPVTFVVQRKDSSDRATIMVKQAYRHDLGMRMRMGEVVALRHDGPAERAGVVPHAEGPPTKHGDRIIAVLLPPDKNGKRLWYVAGSPDWTKPAFQLPEEDLKALQAQVTVKPLDPLLLPRQLNEFAIEWLKWARGANGKVPVDLVVSREAHPTNETIRLPLLSFDPSFRFDSESALQPNSPLPLSGLGLAYWVDAIVDDVTPGGPAAAAGVKPGDPIVAVRFNAQDDAGNTKAGEWKDDLKSHQWASVDNVFQGSPPVLDIKVKRSENETVDLTLRGTPDPRWPLEDRGLFFQAEVQVQQAADVGDAMRLGGLRTVRFIKTVYMNLYAMIIGRVSAKTMSGPLTIANVSYKLAGEDFWQFLLFLGMISVNLAVVNFLPIPVLDGGHMVFLLWEKISGRPVPERLFAIFMYMGLFLILSLMVFVLFLDVKRLFFGWF